MWVTKFTIDIRDMGFKYNGDFDIAQSFNINVIFEKFNFTPLIENPYLAKEIDFTDLDISNKITVSFSPLIMHLK